MRSTVKLHNKKWYLRFPKLRKLYFLRVKILLLTISFIILYVSLNMLKILLRKKPWTSVPWQDPDYSEIVSSSPVDFHNHNHNQYKEIVILRWTSYWGAYDKPKILDSANTCNYLELENRRNNEKRKPFDIPCRITFDRRYLKRSHALVFHSFDLMKEEVPEERDPKQFWVYMQQESPIYTKLNLQAYENIFNWTMTYRRDSDMYHPYGHIIPVSSASNESVAKSKVKVNLSNKSELVAWIVSSCDSNSDREYLVKELQKYVKVDIYGWCGQDCPENEDCYEHIAKTHKFYLAFENSLCTDYITEKFFKAMKLNVVPVVYGGGFRGKEDYEKIAPRGSYINVEDFKTVKDLADYLLHLDRNDDDYLRFFEWKNHFKVVKGQGWCNLCQRVYDHFALAAASYSSEVETDYKQKAYKNIWTWWNYRNYQSGRNSKWSDYSNGLACRSANKNLTSVSQNKSPDFEPGLLNGRIFTKIISWIRNYFISP